MNIAKFSIIVPVFKVEQELRRCVKSIINQTFKNIEIILVDDGSPDSCPQICDEYAKLDNRVKVYHKQNGGLSDARNYGLLKATGEYILFIDSDDYIAEKTCELFNNRIDSSNSVEIIVGAALRIEGNKTNTLKFKSFGINDIIEGPEFLKLQLENKSMHMPVWMNVYKRTFLLENNFFFKKGILHEDEQWTPRVFLKAKNVAMISSEFYYYIIREDSITKSKIKEKNALDLISTCYELEAIYKDLSDFILKKYLNEYLLIIFLNAIDMGNLYDGKYNGVYSKRFLFGKPISLKNKARVLVFLINKNIYKHIYELVKKRF